jgi:hypothetical protein
LARAYIAHFEATGKPIEENPLAARKRRRIDEY